jgi:hypothetical protein
MPSAHRVCCFLIYPLIAFICNGDPKLAFMFHGFTWGAPRVVKCTFSVRSDRHCSWGVSCQPILGSCHLSGTVFWELALIELLSSNFHISYYFLITPRPQLFVQFISTWCGLE